PEGTIATLKQFEGGLFASYEETVKDPDRPELEFARYKIGEVTLAGHASLTCAPAVNIPGRVLAIENLQLVTDDDRTLDIRQRGESAEDRYYQVTTEKILSSVQLTNGLAALKDI